MESERLVAGASASLDSPHSTTQDDSNTSELSGPAPTTLNEAEYRGKSTIFSSLINLINSIIGVGVMTLPYSFKFDGILLGLFLLLISFLFTHITYHYLVVASCHTQHYQYKDIAEILFRHRAWGYTISIVTIIYVSGSLTSYSIAIMDNMYWWADNNPTNKTYKIILCACILYLVVVPLSCLKNLDFMQFNGYVAVFCELVITVVISAFYFVYTGEKKPPEMAKLNLDSMTTLPLMSASMCGHFATTFVYKELRNRSQKRMTEVILLNLAVLMAMYLCIGFFGYLTFTGDCDSDILKTVAKYAKGKWYLQAGHVAQLLLIICHFPVTCYGCRMALESIIWPKRQAPLWGTIAIVVGIITVLMLLSLFVTEISDVMDVTSILGGSFVIFITPASFMCAIHRREGAKWPKYITPCIIIVFGSVQFIFGGIGTIRKFLDGDHGDT